MGKRKISVRPATKLSPGEMEVMEIVWDKGEIAAQEVREILSERKEVAKNTVRTMLSRMETKGWLKHRVVSQTFFYSATVPREASLSERVLDFVDRACGGVPDRLVNALIAGRGLSRDEIQRIRDLLDSIEDNPHEGDDHDN